MKKRSITRNVIQIISKNSNWPAADIKESLINEVYEDRNSWAEFVKTALIGLGASFCLAGIIFFLAYNWHLMHKFLKLGLVQGLVIVIVVALLTVKFKPLVRDVLLMSAAVLVGAMFSVFGQIYQTGADAYDFFLGWTVFIAVWALVSNFAPLWLLLLTLINVTFVFFVSQAGPRWPDSTTYLILFVFNALALNGVQFLAAKQKINQPPLWFTRTLALAVAYHITLGMVDCIFDHRQTLWPYFLVLATLNYVFDGYKSFKEKSIFSLCVIPLSVIVIVSTAILDATKRELTTALFFVALLIIGSVTLLLMWLIKLNKSWNEAN